MLHAVDAGGASPPSAPACGSRSAGATSARATSATSSASCPPKERAHERRSPCPSRARRRRAGREHPHAGLARLRLHRRATSRSRFLRGWPRRRSSASAARSAARSTCRPGLLPDRRRAHRANRSSWPTSAPSPRSASSTCPFYGQAMELPYVERADPARRLATSRYAPHPGGRRPTSAHGPAGRSGVGARRRARPDPRDRSSGSDRPASPTPIGTPTEEQRLMQRRRDRLPRADRPHPRPHRRQRGRDADAGPGRGPRRRRHHQGPGRLHLLRQLRLPGRPGLLVRHDPRRRRAVAAHLGVPRGDGRRLGAVRGLGEDPDRPRRHRAGLRLRQVLARRHPPGPVTASSTRTTPSPCGPIRCRWPPSRPGPCSTPAPFTEEQMAEVVAASRRNAKANPHAQLSGDAEAEALLDERLLRPIRCASTTARPITDGAAAVILAAGDVARELSDRPAWIRGIDHRIEPHYARASATSPPRCPPRQAAEKAGVADGRSTSPSCTPRSPTRSSSCGSRSGWVTTCRSTRRAGRWPPTRSWPRASSASARRPPGSPTAKPTGPSATPPRVRACNRTSSASWRVS